MLGLASGVFFAYAGDLPRISALDDYAPSTISRVYGARGEIVGEFAIQRREVIPYEAISPKLKQAILAAEDAPSSSTSASASPASSSRSSRTSIERRKAGGASTLTQQLTRKLFLTDEKTWERKIKEAILAIQIEKRYTKNEIFTLYCNQMYFGHGVYGVQAASRLYFGKAAKDLTLEEAALIAGILQGNVRQSPYVNMDAALRRRNYALTRMADVGYISRGRSRRRAQESRSCSAASRRRSRRSRRISSKTSARSSRRATAPSSSTRTASRSRPRSISPLQEAANRALDEGLRRIDKRRGFRTPRRNVVAEGHAIDDVQARRAGIGRCATATSSRRSCAPPTPRRSTHAPATLRSHDRPEGLRVDVEARRRSWSKPGDLIEVRLGTDRRRGADRQPARWSSRRWSKARSSRSTTAPARSRRWSAATASSAASSTARRRRSARSARRSSRSSTPPRSIAATRRRR